MTTVFANASSFVRNRLIARMFLGCVIGGLLSIAPACADERFFTYIQDADVLPKGAWEFEQWVTLGEGHPGGDRQFDQYRWDFREEIEHGFSDRLSGALYLNFRQDQVVANQIGLMDSSKFSFKGISAELKYQLLNPNTQPIGVALYFEPTFNGNEHELEYKFIVSKNIADKWVLAANAVLEQEWEKEDGATKKESVLEFTLGAAYRFTPNWSAGLEGRYHAVYEGSSLNERLGKAWFLGPNIHYGTAKWWGTLTFLPQISGDPSDGGINRTEHPTYEARVIFGVNF